MVLHSILLVLACQHVRFHCSLNFLEERLAYTFKNRSLLELALIHPSFRANYGTNSDHAKNVLNNCGLRIGLTTITKTTTTSKSPLIPSSPQQQNLNSSSSPLKNVTTENNLELLTKQQLIQKTGRRRGINVLMEIMSMQRLSSSGNNKMKENNGGDDGRIVNRINESIVKHNERLEFLGDAVVEFLTTIHLFFLFTELDEGGLATFRSALVQNRHLATLGDRLGLQHFMVYAHGPDLCHSADLRHAMANTFEALMAAVFLDSGLEQCDKKDTPYGDRHLISSVPCLKLLVEFERCIGITFKHIRLLAKAFTRRNVPYNFLTLGHNQRLEFLGDTILQLLTSEYLYKQFPYHQEGHLSLLRTCLVQATTQAVVCDDLAMVKYLVIPQ
uniref:RNase III domain-containing protein n=1 Tax=Meloidogyne incognita TaxID=6306 RepID=A0A914LQP0_MELIC